MPEYLAPGVYVEEVTSGLHEIPGVSTSTAAFIGMAERGPVNVPTAVNSYAEFETVFGGLLVESYLGFAVRDFFLNGGANAIVVRLVGADAANAALSVADFLPPDGQVSRQGLYALEQAEIFNVLYIPPCRVRTDPLDYDSEVMSAAAAYCEKRRAMLIVDPPKDWSSAAAAVTKFTDAGRDQMGVRSRNAMIYFPRVQQTNPLRNDDVEIFPAGGMVAGIFARMNANAGVWKSPAGADATLIGALSLPIALTEAENGELSALGINCLRHFIELGIVLWGARTLATADAAGGEFKYVPVRRLALFIEESLYRGLQWVVFEPNDEPLWAKVRLCAGQFMATLFRQGALQGNSQKLAYFVKCDSTTTTQTDIDRGAMNVVVGFAPLKPAEFVVITLQMLVRCA